MITSGPKTTHRTWSAALAAMLCAVLTVGTMTPGTAATAVPESFEQFGEVTRVIDGDTISVDIAGDGTSDTWSVRLVGIEAMSIYSRVIEGSYDACHGQEAKRHLASVLRPGTRVRLSSIADTRDRRRRLLRTVWMRDAHGDYTVNAVRKMVTAGHALWFPFKQERAHNHEYHVLADRLAKVSSTRREGTLWDDDHCGSGPRQGARIGLRAKSNADGVDSQNINDEWVLIRNYEPYDIRLTGWKVRDSSQTYFTFPADSWLRARSWVKLHIGKGARTDRHFYWGLPGPKLDNAGSNPGADGDGAYLFDPDEDLRAWSTWPCLERCPNRLAGRVKITRVVYNPSGSDTPEKEFVALKNVSDRVVRLEGWGVREMPNTYLFTRGHRIEPGTTLRLRVGRGRNTATRLHWRLDKTAFANSGGTVEVVNLRNTVAHCKAWGDERC
jgi:endonuclease YncB( thermonuclease family)